MTSIPSYAALLLELEQAFGGKSRQTEVKRRFANLENKMSGHAKMGQDVIQGIFDALHFEHDPELLDDLLQAWEESMAFHAAIEHRTRTFGADERQVAWHLLAYQFAAWAGRKYAFWSLHAPVTPGMPGGDLWFLPRPSAEDPSRLLLPVQTAAEWWRDLLDRPLDAIWENDRHSESRIRNLQYWEAGKLPSRVNIDAAFASHWQFQYGGTFQNRPGEPLEVRFQEAVEFATARKKRDAEALTREIPTVPRSVFKAALSGSADEREKGIFVNAIAGRWQAPSNEAVRRRFLLARVVQDCHQRIAKLITPDLDFATADPVANKVQQLWVLVEASYAFTIEADRGCRSEAETNRRFAELVPYWLAQGPFKAVMSVHPGAPEEFAEFLTDRFRELGEGIGDLFKDGVLPAGLAEPAVDKDAVPARRGMEDLLAKLRDALESGRREEAERLFTEVERHPRKGEFPADIPYLHGRHRLNQGDADGAKKLFDTAFQTCRQGGVGVVRKDIAYACLGTAMAFGSFDGKAEKYFRVLASCLDPLETVGLRPWELMAPEGQEVLFRNVARMASERFWEALYRPYAGSPPLLRPAMVRFEELCEGGLGAVMTGDRGSVRRWVQSNNTMLGERIQDVQGDTFFGLMLKMANMLETSSKAAILSEDDEQEISVANAQFRAGLHLLAEELPSKALDTPDFKLQTPLMLAAVQGDDELVRILLVKGVDFDAQDLLGRTALHAAAANRSFECYMLILRKGANATIRTGGLLPLSALASAMRFGLPQAVQATLEMQAARFKREEIEELLDMARNILCDYKGYRAAMGHEGRKVGPKQAYHMITEMLERHLVGYGAPDGSKKADKGPDETGGA